MPALLASPAVDELANDVEVSGMPRVLPHQMEQDPLDLGHHQRAEVVEVAQEDLGAGYGRASRLRERHGHPEWATSSPASRTRIAERDRRVSAATGVEDAELVALGIEEDHPGLLALADVGSAGAHRQKPLDLSVLVARPEVGM